MQKKRTLLKMVFDQAQKELPKASTTALASFLSVHFEERFGYAKNERTFVRYYKKLIIENGDYNIDNITLDRLSDYIGYADFDDFSRKITEDDMANGPLKITVSDGEHSVSNFSETLSNIVIHITNSPVFNIPEFFTQHKNGFGFAGILLIAGVFAHQSGYFKNTGETDSQKIPQQKIIETSPNIPLQTPARFVAHHDNQPPAIKSVESLRTKECMYWDGDHYEAVLCEEKKGVVAIIAGDERILQILKKINQPDTLTVQNAMGKVWYDKSNRQVEFFTSHGIHPVNGKTLRPVTKYIIEKYVN